MTETKIKSYQDIDGFFDWEELYDNVAESMQEDWVHVEVGVWKGKSICYLAERLKKLNKSNQLFAVDWFKGTTNEQGLLDEAEANGGSILDIFEKNVKDLGLEDLITTIESDSAEAARHFPYNSIPSIFIDANHTYEGVTRDLEAWWPKLAHGGWMLGHDFCAEQIKRAVYHFGYRVDKHAEIHQITGNSFGFQKNHKS